MPVARVVLGALLAAFVLAEGAGSADEAAKVRRHERIGLSARGRPIVAFELGNPNARERVLVVGCIHGNECAGLRIVDVLVRGFLPDAFDLWVIRNLNPDGYALGTRQNAN